MSRKQISFRKTACTRRICGKEETREKKKPKQQTNETKQSKEKNPNNQTKEEYHLDCEGKETKKIG